MPGQDNAVHKYFRHTDRAAHLPLVIRVGVFTTRSQELLPSKIEGVGVEQTMWGKLFGYGDIEVTGSGGTRERFAAIQAPLEFRRAIQEATDGHAGA